MRVAIAAVAGMIAATAVIAATACHGDKRDRPIAIEVKPTPPPPRPLATCDHYAAALDKAGELDVDSDVQQLLRDQAALVRAATRAPRDADRDELAARCASAMLDLARIPTDAASYGVGTTGAGVVGGLVGSAPPPPPPPPPSGPSHGGTTGPNCRRLFAAFDRIGTCADIPSDTRDTLRQQRDVMVGAWSQFPSDPDMQQSIEQGCRIAADGLTQILSQYHCP